MRKPYVLLLALSLVLIAANVYMLSTKKDALAQKRDYIVRLVSETGDTFCTGTVISDHTIVTAAHCIVVETSFGEMLRSTTIGIRNDDNKDLGVIAMPASASVQMDTATLTGNFKAFKHANYITDVTKLMQVATPGAKLKACGYPLGGKLYCTTLLFKDIAVFQWSTKGALIPGMSGGPVFTEDIVGNQTVVATNAAQFDNLALVSPIYNLDSRIK